MVSTLSLKARLRDLNVQFRKHRIGGRVLITHGIVALRPEMVARIDAAIRAFDAFTPDNDPYGEHDFGMLEVEGHKVMFKIDYYDCDLDYASPDPSDSTVTYRVMTIMLVEEY